MKAGSFCWGCKDIALSISWEECSGSASAAEKLYLLGKTEPALAE